MEYISSDTNIWIDFVTIDRLELPFKFPYIYLMNQDAIEDEIRKPPGLGEKLIQLGFQTGDGPLKKAAALEGVHVIGTMGILIVRGTVY